MNLWTCGEGWHNNHHKLPSSYRIGFRWFEWDMSAFFLETFPLMKDRKISNPKLCFDQLRSNERGHSQKMGQVS